MKMPEMPAMSAQLAALTQDNSELRALIYGHAIQYGEAVREACAKVCDRLSVSEYPTDCDDCAAAIRKDTP